MAKGKTEKEDFADPLNNLTSEAHRIASKARRCFLEGHPTIAYEQIAELYSFLDDEVKTWDGLRQKRKVKK